MSKSCISDVCVILLTCDGRLEQFKRAVISVAKQILLPKELIVVNAGQASEIWQIKKKIVNEICCDLFDIFFVESENQQRARNDASLHCTSAWITFLDDDDEWFPEKIQLQCSCTSSDIGLIAGSYLVEEQTGCMHVHDIYPKQDEKMIYGYNYIGCTSFPMISYRYFLEVKGFDENFKSNQEWDLWMRLLQISDAYFVSSILGIKHYSFFSITSDKIKRQNGWRKIYHKHIRFYVFHPCLFSESLRYCYSEFYKYHSYVRSYLYFILFCIEKVTCVISKIYKML